MYVGGVSDVILDAATTGRAQEGIDLHQSCLDVGLGDVIESGGIERDCHCVMSVCTVGDVGGDGCGVRTECHVCLSELPLNVGVGERRARRRRYCARIMSVVSV